MTDCPNAECICDDWPPDECPQCGTTILGANPRDWYVHFRDECETLGRLYCFVSKPDEDGC